MQYYAPKNVTLEQAPTGEKCMVLNARKENYKNRPATSARVNTAGKLAVQYGVIEARVKVPRTADGLWPAFWMLGANSVQNMGNDDSFDYTADYSTGDGIVTENGGTVTVTRCTVPWKAKGRTEVTPWGMVYSAVSLAAKNIIKVSPPFRPVP